MEKWEIHTRMRSGNFKGSGHFGEIDAEEGMILKWIIEKYLRAE
jgi:hypothetical protein